MYLTFIQIHGIDTDKGHLCKHLFYIYTHIEAETQRYRNRVSSGHLEKHTDVQKYTLLQSSFTDFICILYENLIEMKFIFALNDYGRRDDALRISNKFYKSIFIFLSLRNLYLQITPIDCAIPPPCGHLN